MHTIDKNKSLDANFVTRKEINKIGNTECDLSSLYDPSYNDLSGKEIFGNCDEKPIMNKLGLRYINFNTHNFFTIFKHRQCSYNTYGLKSLKLHEEISHTKIEGFRLWKCPHYYKCKFGISEELLSLDIG